MENYVNFYPTPENLANKMLEGIDWKHVKTVLEPSAGKGDLLDAAKNRIKRLSIRITVLRQTALRSIQT